MIVCFFGATNRQGARSEIGRQIERQRSPEQQRNHSMMHTWNILAYAAFSPASVGVSMAAFSTESTNENAGGAHRVLCRRGFGLSLLGCYTRSKDIGALK